MLWKMPSSHETKMNKYKEITSPMKWFNEVIFLGMMKINLENQERKGKSSKMYTQPECQSEKCVVSS